MTNLLRSQLRRTATKVVKVAYPEIGDAINTNEFAAVVVGINHPRSCYWIRITAVKRISSNKTIGQICRRSFEIDHTAA